MKISKTQTRILEDSKRIINVLREYKDFTDFFNNCPASKQCMLTTAAFCSGLYNSSEKYKAIFPERWREMEKAYNEAIYEQIVLVFAKTESITALARAGLIKIIEAAKVKGDADRIKIL